MLRRVRGPGPWRRFRVFPDLVVMGEGGDGELLGWTLTARWASPHHSVTEANKNNDVKETDKRLKASPENVSGPHRLDSSCWRWSGPADSAGSFGPPPAPRCAFAARRSSPERRTGYTAGLKSGWKGCTESEGTPAPLALLVQTDEASEREERGYKYG